MYCLQCFSSERALANHVNNCLTINGNQAINVPKKGENILRFNNFHKQLPVPFQISRLSRKRYRVLRWKMRRIRDHTLKPIRLTKIVVVHIRSYVATMTNIVNQFKRIEVKLPFTNSWKRCSKRLSTVRT